MTPSEPAREAAWEAWERPVYGLLLLWFALRVGWLAFQLHPYVPPDEVTHFGRVMAYTTTWGVPANGPGHYELGLLDHRPWLYYWVMARSLSLDFPGLHELVFARLVNGLLGLATVWIGILWVRDWCRSPWARLLFAVVVSNTLMFTGLSASVSYDNGANLLAAGSVLAFTRFRHTHNPGWGLALAAAVLAGCLAKRTFLPLAFLLFVLLLFRERHELSRWPARLGAWARESGWRAFVGAAAVIVLAVLVAALYGGNLLRYGALRPGYDRVVGLENAMQNRVFARGHIVDAFREGKIDLAEAQQQASRIRHAGDRGDTLFLLRSVQLPESSLMGRVPYVSAWAYRMLKSAVSYLGHRRALKSEDAMIGYALAFLAAAGIGLRRWRPGDAGGVPADCAFLALGYATVLMWLVNYPNYQSYHYIELALQGRYLFPVLLPVYGLLAWGLCECTPPKLQPWICAGVSAFWLYGDLPWLLQHIDEHWIMPV